MAESKSIIALLMGIIILVADIFWLVVGNSYTYTPWLVLGIVIFVATLIWLGIDASFMRGTKPKVTESTSKK